MNILRLLWLLALLPCRVFGDVPAIDGIFPNSVNAGTSVDVSLSGKVKPWPPQFWCSSPEVSITPGEKLPNAKITIDPKAKPGPVLIRAWNEDGAGEPFIFMIDPAAASREVEDEKKDNGSVATAQEVKSELPCVVNGRLNPGKDVDCYRIKLKKGQTFYAFAEAYSFRTGLDAAIHLYHPNGNRVALEHDSDINPDPRLSHTVDSDGLYTIAIMAIPIPPSANVSFHGGSKCSYRINLGLKPGQLPARLLPTAAKADAPVDKPLTPPVDFFQTLKKDPSANQIQFKAKAKETYQIEVLAYENRFPTDPVFTLNTPEGKVIKEIDDVKELYRDGRYDWKASTDGNYTVSVRDRYHRTGPEFRYQLRIQTPAPSFNGSTDKSSYLLEAGKDATVKIKLNRVSNHKAPLKLDVQNLPAGVTIASPPKIPDKSGDISLSLKATETVKSFSGPISLTIKEEESDQKATVAFSFETKDEPFPYLINVTSAIWLTVKAKPEKKAEKEKEKK
ncbi:MAG: hypothetical protein P1U89_04960 [Verrucomicrobiales bacterium]|nr:hypothetical protein [Verrucomicrobiales bacterium]